LPRSVPRYPAELAITARKDEILAAIADRQVVIVAGETGSGKSTQLPKMCLELGRGMEGLIGHTQPRRLAARTIAERIAEELGTEVGGAVGYAVRFTDRVGDATLIKVMTDGILLAEIQRDRHLRRYDTLIIDEAHERSLNIDFILGYLKQLLPQRPDLKVVVTSATIDTERFSAHFGGAPVVEVSGRTYPVEVRYRPLAQDADQAEAICEAVAELGAEGPGDVLVFLSGEREIRDAADALAAGDPGTVGPGAVEILPLYARLSAAEQHRVFQPHPGRRVVLATNVAETSLTVPGIRYVVDPGTARISRYNRRTKVQRLPIEPVSQASANQRAGRCGRLAPGICLRLYSEEDFEARPEFTEPEILRTNLAAVILQMAALRLGDMARFPFLEAPDARNIKDGMALLEELGALDSAVPWAPGAPASDLSGTPRTPGLSGTPRTPGLSGTSRTPGLSGTPRTPGRRLTPLGRRLARLPLDPRLGRMVLEAATHGCVHEVMVITAALAIQDPRERPADKQQAADELHARFAGGDSDFLAYLRLWDHLAEQQEALSSNQFRKLCRAEFLNYLRVREWQDIYSQLRQVTRSLDIKVNTQPADPDQIHRSLLAGLLSHIGVRDGTTRDYQGARGAHFAIAPGSSLFKASPRWVMAAELLETNRLWARVAARIQPEWAERLGAPLVKRSYSEPHWDAERGEAMAYERVALYGLPIVTARKISYGRVDRAGARELFIRHALVEGEWRTHHRFVEHNRRLVDDVRALEARARRRDLLVDEEARFDFYDERIPAAVTSARHFDRWWKEEEAARPELLDFTFDLLIDPGAGPVNLAGYPDTWPVGDTALALSYECDPASASDGITVGVPLPLLDRLEAAGFDWQIPGWREELVTALIRSLPKSLRRSLIPAADYARAFLSRATPSDGRLLEVLARELTRISGEPVSGADFEFERVPAYLRMTFRVEDEAGRTLATGPDLDGLRRRLRDRMRAAIAEAARSFERTGLVEWSFGRLPRTVEVSWAGHTVEAYPALVDEGDSVGVRVLTTRAGQQRAMGAGTRRLLLLAVASPAKTVQRMLPNDTKLVLARSPYGNSAELLGDCITAAVDQLMADHGGPAWDESEFDTLRAAVGAGLVDTAVYVATVVGGILVVANGIEERLDDMTAAALLPAVADMSRQLSGLVFPGFVGAAGVRRLGDVLRYLEAMERRLEKLVRGTRRDQELMGRVLALEEEYRHLRDSRPGDDEVGAIRWMIEELRVSLFAQTLGTAHPVSEPRIRREMDRLRSMEAGTTG
jgi:ATP-dependent helicase HrpA